MAEISQEAARQMLAALRDGAHQVSWLLRALHTQLKLRGENDPVQPGSLMGNAEDWLSEARAAIAAATKAYTGDLGDG